MMLDSHNHSTPLWSPYALKHVVVYDVSCSSVEDGGGSAVNLVVENPVCICGCGELYSQVGVPNSVVSDCVVYCSSTNVYPLIVQSVTLEIMFPLIWLQLP